MTFSREWDQLFRANKHISVWPWSDLVSYVNRYAKPADGFRRVLELGCGVGANLPFFLKQGFDYFALEGSNAAVTRLHEAYPDLGERIRVGDFTQSIPFGGPFDLIIDRGALTCNATEAIRRALAMSFERLRHGGKYMGINWYSTAHSDSSRGDAVDSHTRTNLSAGHLAGTGNVHFSDEAHMLELVTTTGLKVERLEHTQHELSIPAGHERMAWWNFVATKS